MTYLGDLSTGSTLFFGFTTVASSGAPTALSSGGLTVYKDGSTIPDTTGLTLTASFNGVTGFNRVQVDMISTSAFYTPGGQFTCVVSSGGVGSESVAGYVVGQWSIKDRFAQVSSAVSVSTAATITSVTSVSNAVSVSTAATITSVTSVNSTVQADVALWRTEQPSTLDFGAVSVNVVTVRGDIVSSPVSGRIQAYLEAAGLQADAVAEISTGVGAEVWSTGRTFALPIATQVPSTANSAPGMLTYIYGALRNPVSVSSSAKVFSNAAGGVLFGKTLSQDSTSSTGVYTEAVASTST